MVSVKKWFDGLVEDGKGKDEITIEMFKSSFPNHAETSFYREKRRAFTITSREDLEEHWDHDPSLWKPQSKTLNTWKGNEQIKVRYKFEDPGFDLDLLKEQVSELDFNLPEVNISKPEFDKLLEIAIADPHIDQLSWAKQCGNEWNTDIALRVIEDAIWYHIDTTPDVDEIVLAFLGDIFNVDTLGETTTKGTKQDNDSRWMRTFRLAWESIYKSVYRLMAKGYKVTLVIVWGNHDMQRAFFLREVLKAGFLGKDMTILDTFSNRAYYNYGSNLFCYTHKAYRTMKDLAISMSLESDKWSECRNKYARLGHLHTQKKTDFMVKDTEGDVSIETLPALVTKDVWHNMKGYHSPRKSTGTVYDKEKGMLSQQFFDPAW